MHYCNNYDWWFLPVLSENTFCEKMWTRGFTQTVPLTSLNIFIQNGLLIGSICACVWGMKGQSVSLVLVFDIWVCTFSCTLVMWHVGGPWHISPMCFLRVKGCFLIRDIGSWCYGVYQNEVLSLWSFLIKNNTIILGDLCDNCIKSWCLTS